MSNIGSRVRDSYTPSAAKLRPADIAKCQKDILVATFPWLDFPVELLRGDVKGTVALAFPETV